MAAVTIFIKLNASLPKIYFKVILYIMYFQGTKFNLCFLSFYENALYIKNKFDFAS